MANIVAEEAARHPDTPIETFATDEHRIGLKPVTRRVWAPVGERPISHGHHRFEWLYVTAFVSPAAGEVFWYVSNGVSKPFFEALLRLFAEEAGAGRDRIIVLVLDNAGWHGEAGLVVPEGIRLVFQPAYTPELQPAETLWTLVDEPIVNKHLPDLETLDKVISARCAALAAERQHMPSRLPLVAQNRQPEVIKRKSYQPLQALVDIEKPRLPSQRFASQLPVGSESKIASTDQVLRSVQLAACAFGHRACRDNRSVLYHRWPKLCEDMALARGDGRHPRLIKALGRADLLILDLRS